MPIDDDYLPQIQGSNADLQNVCTVALIFSCIDCDQLRLLDRLVVAPVVVLLLLFSSRHLPKAVNTTMINS